MIAYFSIIKMCLNNIKELEYAQYIFTTWVTREAPEYNGK